jgi:hypothetical protein
MHEYFEKEERYKWERANHSMIDEFDKDKIKYMITKVNQTDILLQAFSEECKGVIVTGTITIPKKIAGNSNIDEIIKSRIATLKQNLAEYKLKLNNL